MKARVISGSPDDPKVVAITCPGCEEEHQIWVKYPNSNGGVWKFNNDYENPSFTPSLHIHGVRNRFENFVCHSHITDGVISFCSDTTHWLKGETVELLTITE